MINFVCIYREITFNVFHNGKRVPISLKHVKRSEIVSLKKDEKEIEAWQQVRSMSEISSPAFSYDNGLKLKFSGNTDSDHGNLELDG